MEQFKQVFYTISYTAKQSMKRIMHERGIGEVFFLYINVIENFKLTDTELFS